MSASSLSQKSFILVLVVACLVGWTPLHAVDETDCAGATALGTIAQIGTGDGLIYADGTYAVSGTYVSQAQLQYSIDVFPYKTEILYAQSGSWSFGEIFEGSCNHTFELEVCPMVCDANGCLTCSQQCHQVPVGFQSQPCGPTLYLERCSTTGPSGTYSLEANASGGTPDQYGQYTYQVDVSVDNGPYVRDTTFQSGPFTTSGQCSGSESIVRMRVIDHLGAVSDPVSCACGSSDPAV